MEPSIVDAARDDDGAREDWSERVRGPSGLWHAYYFAQTVRNYADAALLLQRAYGDVVRIRFPTRELCFFHPRHVKHILRTNVRNYPKGPEYDTLKPILGDGIFVSEGDLWTRQRRLLAPEFREATVARFIPFMIQSAEQLFREWDARMRQGPIDVTHDMMRLTLWVIGRTMFRSEFLEESERIGRALEVCLENATFQMLSMGLYKSWLPTKRNRVAREAERELDDTVRTIIRRGRDGDLGTHDVLSRMIGARDPDTGAAMSEQQLIDETKSLVLAGHETTSLALSWAFHLLAQHPAIEARLVEEVERVLRDGAPTADALPKLVYTRMVFLETMRLYPPVPSVTRRVIEPDVIDGVRVTTDDVVVVSPFATHRHPAFWRSPDRFDPDRFSEANAARIEPYSYLPFLLGRRACLGEHFALIEGVLLLAMLVQRYKLTPTSREPVETRPISTLRFARPLIMKVTPRQRALG
jgi:cytochrome P450